MVNRIKITVVGAGRFGSFFGKELEKHYNVIYHDIKRTKDDVKYVSLRESLKSDFIFVTIPINKIEQFLLENKNHFSEDSVLIDCASVKLKVEEWYKQHLNKNTQFVLTHPLFGPDSGKNGLKGLKITIVPGRVKLDNYNFLLDLFMKKLNLDVTYLNSDEHDRLMAYNLSLVHHLGRAFGDLGVYNLPLKMRGLSDLTRISQFVMNDSDRLFKDFYKYNPYSQKVLIKFLEGFNKVTGRLLADVLSSEP